MNTHGKIIATVEARMTSSRLPGKILMEAGSKPLLQILVDRLRRARYVDEVVIATTTNAQDDPVEEMCKRLGMGCFRGSEHNVLERVIGAAKAYKADVLVEVTGDCPFIDPEIVDGLIEKFTENFPQHRYVSNIGEGRTTPWGFDAKVFSTEDLYAIADDNPTDDDREHVSVRFYDPAYADTYRPLVVQYSEELNRPELRIELDYREDYELIKAIYTALVEDNPEFSARDIVRWLDAHPQYRTMAETHSY